jgi:hypothetical protein
MASSSGLTTPVSMPCLKALVSLAIAISMGLRDMVMAP